jgi:hypothetical protein
MVLILATGIAMLLGSLLSYAVAMALILHVAAALVRRGYRGRSFWWNVAVMIIVTLIMAAAHVTQIVLWALALLLCGQVSGFERAFYCSAQNYTTLSYVDVLPPERWRLLGPLEAMNGLLFFGLSTAVLFAVMSHLIVNHLRAERGHRSEAVSRAAEESLSGNYTHAG